MIRRPPSITRTDTLFPYTPLFRSLGATGVFVFAAGISPARAQDIEIVSAPSVADAATLAVDSNAGLDDIIVTAQKREESLQDTQLSIAALRSEERRVGKEGVSTGRSRWSPYH